MKIYRVDFSQIHDNPIGSFASSYKEQRTLMKSEYYLDESKALARKREVYEGVKKLIGFIPRIEVFIVEIEVIE
jgi:hypothetical protein